MGNSKKILDYTGLSQVINNFKNLFAFKTDIPEKYTHPTYPPRTSGLYKITVDEQGHVTSVQEVVKSDILDLGIFSDESFELTDDGKLYFKW